MLKYRRPKKLYSDMSCIKELRAKIIEYSLQEMTLVAMKTCLSILKKSALLLLTTVVLAVICLKALEKVNASHTPRKMEGCGLQDGAYHSFLV